ncbi:hypothetical protein PR048_002241 [Dryococelus australis]|uniref:Uncharacterized protein n=1 Tax=Dryococelus australis TaxID=614101 RepID=A0ABQ9IJN4_9NEOP|nr:hypothetical protein PR048_002241 [Dryococelus australis]
MSNAQKGDAMVMQKSHEDVKCVNALQHFPKLIRDLPEHQANDSGCQERLLYMFTWSHCHVCQQAKYKNGKCNGKYITVTTFTWEMLYLDVVVLLPWSTSGFSVI